MAVPLLIQELVNMLPDLGQPFPPQQRERWLEAVRLNLDLLYGDADDQEAANSDG